jgi:hypothetical protein
VKKWLLSLVAVAAGIGIGCGIGFAIALMSAEDKNALIAQPTENGFQRVFTDMAKLYAFEVLASNCKGTDEMPSVLGNEEDLIQNLREAANGSGFTPPIDVAESRLAIRNAMATEGLKNPKFQAEQVARAQRLLENSGWGEPSASSRMREVIAASDHEECRQASTTGKSTQ